MLTNFPIKAHLTQNPSVSVSLIYSSMFLSEKTKFQWYEWSRKNGRVDSCEVFQMLFIISQFGEVLTSRSSFFWINFYIKDIHIISLNAK
ncbi:hypothetical protein AAG906_029691 [Vitis piasezkii]